jgi:hypothetical protein
MISMGIAGTSRSGIAIARSIARLMIIERATRLGDGREEGCALDVVHVDSSG